VTVGYVSGGCVVILDCILCFPRAQTHERLPHIVMPCSHGIYYLVKVGVSVDISTGLGVDFFSSVWF